MAGTRSLAKGQWLGTSNQVSRLKFVGGRWRMIDTTGAEYDQRDFPEGLVTHDTPQDGTITKPRVPWPAPPRCEAKTFVRDDRMGGWFNYCELPRGHRSLHSSPLTACEPVAAMRWAGTHQSKREAK